MAVALLRGHPPRAGVGLDDEALGLEHRHVVADGRAGHSQRVPVDEGLGADRFLGGDVVRDDGAQDIGPTV